MKLSPVNVPEADPSLDVENFIDPLEPTVIVAEKEVPEGPSPVHPLL